LVELQAVVATCAKARETHACDPALVGPDDRVPLGNAPTAERRLVRLEWLRTLLAKAQIKDAAPNRIQGKPASDANNPGSARPPKPTTSQLLQAAETRLAEELVEADRAASGALPAAADYTSERAAMTHVLAERDFRNLQAPTARDTAMEKLSAWLNRLLASLDKLQLHAAWVGRLIVWGFILAVCVGLALGLMQLERRWRIRLIPESDGPATGAPSARDWQLWLADARRAAAAGLWREAIHFAYWASISRLESKRLWPADRARTPREYLALVSANDPRKPQLATLTANFERVWYGGRAAAESDYRKAEALADALISGTQGGAR
jgi:hypothetical protein